ncbi:hypothetical protein V5799_003603 [Amblyomma americanum]|uniref:Uncharacterized protein n=1 Tax=Amblyomma americanum TaxID=6943 RepID=A0AAQ4D8H5_AMBAM
MVLAKVFDALNHTTCLRRLSVVTSRLTLNTAQSLSALVAQCKRCLIELHIVSVGPIPDAVLGVLHEMVIRNVFLSRISVGGSAWDDAVRASVAIDDAKMHNQRLLNKAARFVMRLDGMPEALPDHNCAAAFDEMCGAASLRYHLVALSGKSEAQVSLNVKRARRYLLENFMVLAGVVHAAVVCNAGVGTTQLDALNGDCWCAIAQYLKLSDVIR